MRTGRATIALGLALLALTGCGSDDEPDGSPADPVRAERDAGDVNEGSPPAARTATAPRPGYADLVDRQGEARPERRFSPCDLVLRAEARRILRRPVKQPIEAPQGPTCIYDAGRGEPQVTLVVQQAGFARAAARLQGRRSVDVGGGQAVCGSQGRPVLLLRVGDDRVLKVDARCEIARRFAERAAGRLKG